MSENCGTQACKRRDGDGEIGNPGQTVSWRKDRLVYLDVLRLLAAVFVIVAHTVSLGAAMVSPQSGKWYAFEIIAWFFLCCNPLFVLMSGALLLPVQGETPWAFYRKRLFRVLVPMIVYYFLYVCAKEGIHWIFPDHWTRMAGRILQGPPKEAPHFWLIYVLLGLYILTPLLRLLLRRLPQKRYGWTAVGILLCLMAYTCLDVLFENRVVSTVVNSYIGVFLLGYLLVHFGGRQENYAVWGGGALSVIGAIWFILNKGEYQRYVFNNAPLMVLYSMAIFLAIKEIFRKKGKTPAVLQLMSRYSYEILLIHWGVLHFLVKRLLGIVPTTIAGIFLMIAATLFFSLAGAVVVDRTLIAGLIWMLQKCGRIISAALGRIRQSSS